MVRNITPWPGGSNHTGLELLFVRRSDPGRAFSDLPRFRKERILVAHNNGFCCGTEFFTPCLECIQVRYRPLFAEGALYGHPASSR
jgi:hypothetical protein